MLTTSRRVPYDDDAQATLRLGEVVSITEPLVSVNEKYRLEIAGSEHATVGYSIVPQFDVKNCNVGRVYRHTSKRAIAIARAHERLRPARVGMAGGRGG